MLGAMATTVVQSPVSGVACSMNLWLMIDSGWISSSDALVGAAAAA